MLRLSDVNRLSPIVTAGRDDPRVAYLNLNQRLLLLNPEPYNLNPEPWTLNPEPETLNPKP